MTTNSVSTGSLLEDSIAVIGQIVPIAQTATASMTGMEAYCVLTPLIDTLDLHADNAPGVEVQEVRISLFTTVNYRPYLTRLTTALLRSGFTITQRRYIGFEADTGWYHYAIDIAHTYPTNM